MVKRSWRIIRSGTLSGAMNMAIDEALLESVAAGISPPVLRLYRWQPATLTLGYGQPVTDIDLQACQAAGVDVVRRSTGGRAVLHDHEVTYAVVADYNAEPFASSVLDCYRTIALVLQSLMTDLGITADLVAGRSRGGYSNPSRAVCFSSPSQYELVVEGRKVVGSAQKRQGQAFLQHGSIPIELDVNLLASILKVGSAHYKSLDKVGWLNRWARSSLSIDYIEDQLVKAFHDRLDLIWEDTGLTAEESARATTLSEQKFGCPIWTMKR